MLERLEVMVKMVILELLELKVILEPPKQFPMVIQS